MNLNGTKTMLLGGSATTSDSLTVTVNDIGLSGGTEAVNYTVPGSSSISSITSGIASAINADTALQNIAVSATASGPVLSITSMSPNHTSYLCSRGSGATETITPYVPANGIETAAIAGTITASDSLSINVFDAGLSGGKETVSYSVMSGDSLSSIASSLASAINGDSNLTAIGVSASAVSSVVNITSTSQNATTYSQSTNSGATESIVLGRALVWPSMPATT